MYCLDPPLEAIPDDDWYCPLCKNDESEIVGKGQMVKYGYVLQLTISFRWTFEKP